MFRNVKQKRKGLVSMSELSDGMVETTLDLIEKMFYNNEKINVSAVAKKGKVSRQFLYNHQEIINRISFFQNFNSLSIEERFTKLKAQNQELRDRLERYEDYVLDLAMHKD